MKNIFTKKGSSKEMRVEEHTPKTAEIKLEEIEMFLYDYLDYAKDGIIYSEIQDHIQEYIKLLNIHRVFHCYRLNVPVNEEDREIQNIVLNDSMQEMRLDFQEWAENSFNRNFNEFNLEKTLDENWKSICNAESLSILAFYVRKICKCLGKKYSSLFSLKTLKRYADKYCKIGE